MDPLWIVAVVSGALFALGVLYYAIVRVPRWRRMTAPEFVADFGRAIVVADRIQPILAFIAIAASAAYAITSTGTTQVLAAIAAVVYAIVIGASVGVLVPLQRRIVADAGGDAAMRQRWYQGHLARTGLAIVALLLVVAAGWQDVGA